MFLSVPNSIRCSIKELVCNFDNCLPLKLVGGDRLIIDSNDKMSLLSQELPISDGEYRVDIDTPQGLKDYIASILDFGESVNLRGFCIIIPNKPEVVEFWKYYRNEERGIILPNMNFDLASSLSEYADLAMIKLNSEGICNVPEELSKTVMSYFLSIAYSSGYTKDEIIKGHFERQDDLVTLNFKSESEEVTITHTSLNEICFYQSEERDYSYEDLTFSVPEMVELLNQIIPMVDKINISYSGTDWSRYDCFNTARLEKTQNGITLVV